MDNKFKKIIRLQLILFIFGLLALVTTGVLLVFNLFLQKNISVIVIIGGFVISNICLFLALKSQNNNK